MRVLLATLGSAGDVHPLLAVGAALRARGHEVELLTTPVFEAQTRAAGINFHPIGTRAQYESTLQNPRLWHPIDGLGVMWRGLLRPAMEPVFRRIQEVAGQGRCVVMASPVVFGARLANEKLGVPLVSAYTAATMLRSCHHPLTMASWRVPRWVPRPVRRAAWRLLDRYKLEPMARPGWQELRRALDLPDIEQNLFGQWMHSPDAGVTLFPDWFAPAAPDWPAQVVQAGFPLYDGDGQPDGHEALERFLDAGEAPLVFMPGTAMRHGRPFFEAAAAACAALGQRGVLLGDDAGQMGLPLPANLHHARYAPFGRLLPRARALVHHGGVGSCAQALRAGIAQLIVPQAYDQFDNAMRLEHLGVGASLGYGGRSLDAMTPRLARLLASPGVAAACQRNAARLNPSESLSMVCEIVERFR